MVRYKYYLGLSFNINPLKGGLTPSVMRLGDVLVHKLLFGGLSGQGIVSAVKKKIIVKVTWISLFM